MAKINLKDVTLSAADAKAETKLKKIWPDVYWALGQIAGRVRNPFAKVAIGMVKDLGAALWGIPES